MRRRGCTTGPCCGGTSAPTCLYQPCLALTSNGWCGMCVQGTIFQTLTFSVTFTGSYTGTHTMVYGAQGYDGIGYFVNLSGHYLGVGISAVQLYASTADTIFIEAFIGTVSFANTISGMTGGTQVEFSTCNPLTRTTTPSTGVWNSLFLYGITSVAITGPISGTNPFYVTYCYPTFYVSGCLGEVATGAAIDIWNSSSKTTHYGSATVGATNPTQVTVSALSANFYYEVSGAGYVTATGTQDGVNPSDSISVSLTTSGGYCCQQFYVRGCNSLFFPNGTMTINVYTSLGGTLLASGSSGLIAQWSGSCSVYITITDSLGRMAAYGASSVLTSGGFVDLTMTAAANYYCITAQTQSSTYCIYPLPSTLHSTFASVTGTQAWTYSGGVWTTTFTYLTITYVMTIDTTGAMTGTSGLGAFSPVALLNTCPVVGPYESDIYPNDPGSLLGMGMLTE